MRTIHQRDIETIRRRSRRESGRIVILLLLLVIIVVAVFGLFCLLTEKSKNRQICEDNLKKIYRALEQFENDRGVLPTLAYFPADPQADSDSLPVALESYGADAHTCICPAMHLVLREMGLTYIWNSSLSGKRIPRSGAPVWMLVEMTAISSDLPAPHIHQFNVLYSDGSVKHVTNPLKELPGL